MLKLCIGALAATVLSACVTMTVDEKPADGEQTATLVNKDGEKLVCKGTRKTGTRIPQKPVCKTQAEWDYLAAESGDVVDTIRNRTTRQGTLSPN